MYMRRFIEQCVDVIDDRGSRLDRSLPIHHKMSPEGMLHEVDKKTARVHAFIEEPNWTTNPKTLNIVKEECRDIINHALFLGAFCEMLEFELEED